MTDAKKSDEQTLFETSDPEIEWDLPNPFTIDLQVGSEEIDAYGHVNNAVYVSWCDKIAWAHTAAVGIGEEEFRRLDRGMAVRETEIHHLGAALEGDRIRVGNWMYWADGRLKAQRRFQIVRMNDGATLARAVSLYVCIELSTGKPKRWPPEFQQRYRVRPWVEEARAEVSSAFRMQP